MGSSIAGNDALPEVIDKSSAIVVVDINSALQRRACSSLRRNIGVGEDEDA